MKFASAGVGATFARIASIPATSTFSSTIRQWTFAADLQLRGYFAGTIDEVRISNVARSAAWIATELASMKDTLVAYGAEQPAP